MDYELLTQELLEYYANLLIVQYNGKSKASQTIKLLADMLIVGCLIFQIRDAFDYRTAVVQNAYNFTVVGTPKITADGIASGFSSNSFLQISINLSNKPFIFETPKFVYSQVTSDRQYLFTYGSYNTNLFMQAFITNTGVLNTSMRNNTTDIFYKSYQLTLNNSYQIKYVLNNTEASIYLKTNDNDYELWYTTTNTSLYTVNNTNMRIGQEYNGSTRFYLGSIDLKQFSITVDGVEVYRAWQPPAINYRAAVGTQLDIIGKWVGVSRFYNASKYWNATFLSYPNSNDLVPTDKTDTLQHGYSDYSNFDSETGNILTYDALSSVKQSLSDDNYRIVIGLKIIKNNINHIRGEIDKAIWDYFNHRVYTTWSSHKITYNYPPELADIINICAYKKVLPVPIGCSISYYQYS